MLGRFLPPLLLALVALCSPAHAAIVSASVEDPAGDTTAGPGTDILRASWSFDPEAGRWTVSVTFAATPAGDDYGIVNAVIRDNSAPECGGSQFGVFRGTAKTGSASAGAGSAEDGVQPDGSTGPTYVPATNVKSDDGRTTTLEVAHPRLVGRSAACVQFTISNHGVKDAATVVAPDVPVVPGGGGPPAPGDPSQPPTTAPPETRVNLRLASSRTLRFRKGAARVTFTRTAAGMRTKLSLVAGKRRIAQGRFGAASPVAINTKLFLTRAGATYFRRHRGGRATLIARTTLNGRTVEQRFRVRLRR